MKKYILSFVLIALIIPSVALAVWWNPLSWNVWSKIFHKNITIETPEVNTNQVQENPIINNENQTEPQNSQDEKINELERQIEELKKQLTTSGNNNTVASKPTQNVNTGNNTVKINTPEPTTPIISTTTTKSDEIVILNITNVQTKVVGNNVTITWDTNLPTESILTLIGSVEKVYPSDNGLSKNHSVTIYNLITKNEYNFKLTAITVDKNQTDTHHGSFYVIEKFIAYLGAYDEDKCQTIILMDRNGRLKNKQISIGLSAVSSYTTISYGRIKVETDSNGEIRYCDKPSANQYMVDYLNYDAIILKR